MSIPEDKLLDSVMKACDLINAFRRKEKIGSREHRFLTSARDYLSQQLSEEQQLGLRWSDEQEEAMRAIAD